MTRDEFIAYLKNACDRMIDIVEKKNHDYTGSEDPFANFKACEAMGICDAEIGILVRRVDKLKRVITFVKKGILKVTDESVEDTLLDDANYALILAALIHSKRVKDAKRAPAAQAWDIRFADHAIQLLRRNGKWCMTIDGVNWVEDDLISMKCRCAAQYGSYGEGWPLADVRVVNNG